MKRNSSYRVVSFFRKAAHIGKDTWLPFQHLPLFSLCECTPNFGSKNLSSAGLGVNLTYSKSVRVWHFFMETVIGLEMDLGPSLQPNGDEFKFMALGENFPFF